MGCLEWVRLGRCVFACQMPLQCKYKKSSIGNLMRVPGQTMEQSELRRSSGDCAAHVESHFIRQTQTQTQTRSAVDSRRSTSPSESPTVEQLIKYHNLSNDNATAASVRQRPRSMLCRTAAVPLPVCVRARSICLLAPIPTPCHTTPYHTQASLSLSLALCHGGFRKLQLNLFEQFSLTQQSQNPNRPIWLVLFLFIPMALPNGAIKAIYLA